MKKRNLKIKLLCIFLATWMLLSTTPIAALGDLLGVGANSALSTPEASVQGQSSDGVGEESTPSQSNIGELSVTELATMQVDPGKIPEVIPLAEAQERGLVNRLYAQETSLSTVLFQRQNGEKTAYVYSRPVKYVDADGTVRDKSAAVSALLNATHAYAMQNNSVKAYFPKSSASGVMLTYNDYRITLVPEGTAAAPTLSDGNCVSYPGVFGPSTILSYTTDLYGVKEDIVLVKKSTQTQYSFLLNTVGLILTEESGEWVLCNQEGQKVMSFEQIIAKDSGEKEITGSMTVTPISANQYRLTVSVPLEFLQASDTVYPVYIDPTTTVTEYEYRYYADPEYGEDEGDFETIVDVGIYEMQEDTEAALDDQNRLGLGNMDGGDEYAARIIYKLFDFHHMYGLFKGLSAEQIRSVKLYVNATYPDEDVVIRAAPMTSTWSDSEPPVALWQGEDMSLWNGCVTSSYSDEVDLSHGVNEIDITSIAKGWANYNRGISTQAKDNPDNGFSLFMVEDGYGNTYIRSTEMSGNSNVYYVVDYGTLAGPRYLVNDISGSTKVQSVKFYQEPDGEQECWGIIGDYVSASSIGQWTFEYMGTNANGIPEYKIRSMADNYYCLCMYSESVDVGGDYYQYQSYWYVEQVFGGYLIRSKQYSDRYLYNNNGDLYYTTNSSLPGAKWQVISVADYVPLVDFTLENYEIERGSHDWLDFIPYPIGSSRCNDSNFICSIDSGSGYTLDADNKLTASSTGNPAIFLEVTHRYSGVRRMFYVAADITYEYIKAGAESKFDYFLAASDTISSDGTHNLEAIDLNIDQKRFAWIMVPMGSGQYYIINAETQGFLGSRNNIYTYYTKLSVIDTPTLWNYTISSQNGTSFTLSHADATQQGVVYANLSLTSSNNICLRLTTSVDEKYSLFKRTHKEHEVDIKLYYDQAFRERYGADYATVIYDAVTIMRANFMEEFGMWFNISTPQLFVSFADQCTSDVVENALYYQTDCDCGDDVDHKDGSQNLALIEQSSDYLTLLFSGHDMHVIENGQRIEILGVATPPSLSSLGTRAMICGHDSIDRMGQTTTHETGHFFDAPDHYENQVPSGSAFNDDCIYGFGKEQTKDRRVCSGCYQIIDSNIDRFD